MAENIEDKEIRGINFKLVRAFTIGTISVVLSIAYSYFNLRNSITKMQTEQVGDGRYNDLKMKTIEMNLSAIQLQIDNLREQVNENTRNINKQHPK